MLAEWLTSLTTPFPRPARRVGFLREQIAIRARERRHRAGWAGHLATARKLVLETADRCPQHAQAVVVGAGVCLDVPVAGLAERFAKVALLDVGFLDRSGPGERIPFDATGCLQRWHDRPSATEDVWLSWADGDAGWPEGLAAPDLTVSANLIGQLAGIPVAWRRRHRACTEEFKERLGDRLAQAHLRWLRARPGLRLLIADVAELAIDRSGAIADQQPAAAARLGLRPPDRTWEWDIAPIPEWDPDHHLRHRVGAWVDP